jgi:alanyl-tRNA synthetase
LGDLKNYSRKSLDSLQPYVFDSNKATLFHGIFNDLIDSEIRAFADMRIANSNTIVIIANAPNDDGNNNNNNNNSPVSEPTATIVVAANESLKAIDCNEIVKEIVGRGGGKPHFATGLIKKNEMADIVSTIIALVKKKL